MDHLGRRTLAVRVDQEPEAGKEFSLIPFPVQVLTADPLLAPTAVDDQGGLIRALTGVQNPVLADGRDAQEQIDISDQVLVRIAGVKYLRDQDRRGVRQSSELRGKSTG